MFMKKQNEVKDIFVDSCVAIRLENPLDPDFVDFLEWLLLYGAPVLTPKILKEYNDSLDAGSSNFIAIINACQREGRVVDLSNEALKALRFSKKVEKHLQSNKKDWWHIKAVILSPRKIAVSFDAKMVGDINNFPGYKAKAGNSVSVLPYK